MIFPKKVLSLSLAAIVLAALGYELLRSRNSAGGTVGGDVVPRAGQASSGVTTGQKAEDTPLPVKAIKVGRGDLVVRLKSPGEAFTQRKAAIKAEVSGVVKSVSAEEGKHVKAASVLIAIHDRRYVLQLDSAEADRLNKLSLILLDNQFRGPEKAIDPSLAERIKGSSAILESAALRVSKGEISRTEYERVRKVHESLLIEAGMKRDEVHAAATGLTQAEVAVAAARMQLEKAEVRAPFDGLLTGIKVSVGESVSVGQELFTLVDIREIRVAAMVLESEIGKMKPGQEVDLRFNAYPGKTFKGRVLAVSPVVNPEEKTCAVHISVSNPSEELKPGMHAEVEIAAAVYPNRLLVPQEAVLVRGGRRLVFTVEDGLAKWKYIESGLENERFVEVLEGVKEGEEVIVEGHLTLAHDAKVKIVE
jgi:RND family efflux transporter MFP subunit